MHVLRTSWQCHWQRCECTYNNDISLHFPLIRIHRSRTRVLARRCTMYGSATVTCSACSYTRALSTTALATNAFRCAFVLQKSKIQLISSVDRSKRLRYRQSDHVRSAVQQSGVFSHAFYQQLTTIPGQYGIRRGARVQVRRQGNHLLSVRRIALHERRERLCWCYGIYARVISHTNNNLPAA